MHKRGLNFTAYAVEYDSELDEFTDTENTQNMNARCGGPVEFVPQIFIDNQHIGGWRKLEPLIQSGEIEKLLSKGNTLP